MHRHDSGFGLDDLILHDSELHKRSREVRLTLKYMHDISDTDIQKASQ